MFGACPNISGSFGGLVDWRNYGDLGHSCSYPFSVDWEGTYRDLTGSNDTPQSNRDISMSFDANKSNAIYSGSKMQPSALQILACIRI